MNEIEIKITLSNGEQKHILVDLLSIQYARQQGRIRTLFGMIDNHLKAIIEEDCHVRL